MKIKLLLCGTLLNFSTFAAVEAQEKTAELKPLNNVRVSMQRMLRSVEGRYFLDLYAGIWNPHGTLYDLTNQNSIALKGLQKGDQLSLQSVSVNEEMLSSEQYQLNGNLNANTGMFSSTLSSKLSKLNTPIQFEPAFKVAEKPLFTFKFYGADTGQSPNQTTLNQIQVMNKTQNTVVQRLTGFEAYPYSIGYMDINFDGFYDIILSDLSNGRKPEDKHFIYWMYNPKTQKFQRSPQLENIIGFPNLKGEKQQIDFGNGQIYQVTHGLLNRLN